MQILWGCSSTNRRTTPEVQHYPFFCGPIKLIGSAGKMKPGDESLNLCRVFWRLQWSTAWAQPSILAYNCSRQPCQPIVRPDIGGGGLEPLATRAVGYLHTGPGNLTPSKHPSDISSLLTSCQLTFCLLGGAPLQDLIGATGRSALSSD